MYKVRQIPFETLKDYWEEVGHFHVPGKVITEDVPALGPYRRPLENPEPSTSYGLFDGYNMIGGTQFCPWTDDTVRWRANNIREAYRGVDLFWQFQCMIMFCDWAYRTSRIIGWFRSSAYGWAEKHGYTPVDGIWHEHDGDRYILVEQDAMNLVDSMIRSPRHTWHVDYNGILDQSEGDADNVGIP